MINQSRCKCTILALFLALGLSTPLASTSHADVKYPTGTVTGYDQYGTNLVVKFPEGIVETQLGDGGIKTECPDGTKHMKFADNEIEITFADGNTLTPNINSKEPAEFVEGISAITHPDGTVVEVEYYGTKNIKYPNGMVEIFVADGGHILVCPNGVKKHTLAGGEEVVIEK